MRASRLNQTSVARVLTAIVALAASGCGYHFAASGAALPASAQTIYVRPFDNHSRTPGASELLTVYMKDEIAKHKRLTIVKNPADADLVLSGTVADVEEMPAGFNGALEPTTWNYMVSVNASLTDNRTKKVLWAGSGISTQSQVGGVAQAVAASSPQFLLQNLRARDLQKMTDYQVYYTQSYYGEQQSLQGAASEIYDQMSEGF
jgi:hypothetical protein